MNFRNLVLIVLSMIANQSFAQTCVPAPQIMGQPQRCWDGRLIGNGGVVFQQQVLTQQVLPAQLVQARQAIPANCQLVRKTFWERASNGAQSAFLDGVVGALAGNAVDRIRQSGGQWTHVGANAGAAVGFAQGISDEYTMICHNAPPTPEQEARKKKKTEEGYSGKPTEINGRKCAFVTTEGRLIADYFDEDRNPEGIKIPTEGAGPRCAELLTNAQKRYYQ